VPRYSKGRGGGKRLWEIEVVGASYVVRYGKPEALDQMRREFASEREARRAAESFIADRLGDGYRLIDDTPALPDIALPTPTAREPALEAAIVAAPDDRDAYLVYADWLQQHDDIHGQLIALQAATDRTGDELQEAERGLLAAHAGALLGALAPSCAVDGPVRIRWRWGFADHVRIEHDDERGLEAHQLLEQLLSLPIARVVRSLVFGRPCDGEFVYSEVIEALVHLAPRLAPTLRVLELGDFVYPDESEMSWVEVGDVSPLYAAYPELETLTLQGNVTLGRIEHDRLRSFEVRTGGLSAADVAAIANARWPRLERLIVWFGDDNWGAGGTADDIPALLARAPSGLVQLGLCNAAFTDDIVAHLAAWPDLERLVGLDLSRGTLTDDGAHQLVALAPRLSSLSSLDVSENLLGEDACARLAAAYPNLVHGGQRDPDDERYPAVGE